MSRALTAAGMAGRMEGAMGAYEIETTLVLSTGHIRPETGARLNAMSFEDQIAATWGPNMVYEEGWIWWVRHEDDDPEHYEIPSEICDIIRLARSLGCRWVRFDCDATIYPDLPHWSW